MTEVGESKAASFSRVILYEKCPASYEWQYELGNKQPFDPNGAAARGLRMHDAVEQWHLGKADLEEEWVTPKIAKHLNTYYNDPKWVAIPEFEFALTKDWEPTEFDAEDAYIRGYMDCLFVNESENLLAIDEYKSGQEWPEHPDQKALYGMVAMILYPLVNSVPAVGVYFDKNKLVPTTYNRPALFSMKMNWKRRIDRMAIPMYPARPGRHCMWCPKSYKKGGPCQLG